jgi:hypothetical protein
VFEGFGIVLLCAVTLGIGYLLAPEATATVFADFMSEQDAADLGPVIPDTPTTEPGSFVPVIIFATFVLITVVLRATLLAAIAGGAIGRDPNGQYHTPFSGFGTYFFSSFVVTALSFSWVILGVVALWFLVKIFGLTSAFENIHQRLQNGAFSDLGWPEFFFYLYCLTLWLWSYAIQSAGALLIHAKLHTKFENDRSVQQPTEQLTAQDVRALWKSRM